LCRHKRSKCFHMCAINSLYGNSLCALLPSCMHAHKPTHPYTQTHTHIQSHTHMHARTHTHIDIHTQAHTQAHTGTHTHIFTNREAPQTQVHPNGKEPENWSRVEVSLHD